MSKLLPSLPWQPLTSGSESFSPPCPYVGHNTTRMISLRRCGRCSEGRKGRSKGRFFICPR
eukprot:750456-Hanusia_phi.AAC.3